MYISGEILLVLKFGMVFSGLVLNLALRSSGFRFKGDAHFLVGQVILSVGTGFISYTGGPFPPLFLDAGGRALAILGLILLCHSLWRYRFRTSFPLGSYLIFPVFLALEFLFFMDDIRSLATLFVLVSSALVLALYALLVLGTDLFTRKAVQFSSYPLLLYAMLNLLRLVLSLFFPTLRVLPEDGDAFWSLISTFAAMACVSYAYFLLASARMIRDLTRKDQALELRNHELADINAQKNLFISLLAHDLRGPVGGSARYVRRHLLNKPGMDKTQTESILALSLSLNRASELLDKLMLWSKSQRSDWHPKAERIVLKDVVESQLALVQHEAGAKDIGFGLANLNHPVWAEPASVELIVRNILVNAIKYSRTGGTIYCWAKREGYHTCLSIKDHGVGMNKEQAQGLFSTERLHSTLGTAGETGNGIGLILCRDFATRNHGLLLVDSVEGSYTRVDLTLPLPPSG